MHDRFKRFVSVFSRNRSLEAAKQSQGTSDSSRSAQLDSSQPDTAAGTDVAQELSIQENATGSAVFV